MILKVHRPAREVQMEGEDDLLVENALLRQLLVEAGLHAAEQELGNFSD